MNSLGMTPLPDGVCYICQSKPATNTYTFAEPRGYGSAFDIILGDTKLCCCDDCDRKRFAKWFSEKPKVEDLVETYTYEGEMARFFDTLPVNAQEKIYNHSGDMDSQDWIDMHLGELSPEQAKKYGLDDELFSMEFEV